MNGDKKEQIVIVNGEMKRLKIYLTEPEFKILSDKMGWEVYKRKETELYEFYFIRRRDDVRAGK